MNCERCGDELATIAIGTMSNPSAVYHVPCNCPRPRCPFCVSALNNQRCTGSDCFMWHELVPLPVMA